MVKTAPGEHHRDESTQTTQRPTAPDQRRIQIHVVRSKKKQPVQLLCNPHLVGDSIVIIQYYEVPPNTFGGFLTKVSYVAIFASVSPYSINCQKMADAPYFGLAPRQPHDFQMLPVCSLYLNQFILQHPSFSLNNNRSRVQSYVAEFAVAEFHCSIRRTATSVTRYIYPLGMTPCFLREINK